jgi:hypothetical protein
MTQFIESRRVALKAAMRTGFIRLEISTLAFGTLHGTIIAYYPPEGKYLVREKQLSRVILRN